MDTSDVMGASWHNWDNYDQLMIAKQGTYHVKTIGMSILLVSLYTIYEGDIHPNGCRETTITHMLYMLYRHCEMHSISHILVLVT